MNLKQIAQKLWSKTQDDEGWVRQNKFTPVKQVQQMGQNLNAWGNIAKQGIQNQVEVQKQDFNKYAWQPLKANPVLGPTLNRFEQATPSIGNQLKQLNPFAQKQTPQQNWQDTKKIGAAALTAYGLVKAPLSAVLGGAVINPLIKLGTNIYENKKGEQLNQQLSQYGQSRTDVPLFAQQTPYQNKPITQGVPESIFEGAGQGLANSGTNRLTNSLVQHFASSVPFFNKLTEKSIASGVPVATDTIKEATKKFFKTAGKRLIKAAVLETAVESPIWATFTQSEQETYLEALQREAIQNLQMNVGMANVQSLGDARSLIPIVKNSVDTAVNNYFKNVSSPENLKRQAGYIDFMGNVVDGTDRTNRFNNLVDTYYKPNATVEEKYNAFAEIRRLAGDIFSKKKIAKLNIGDNRDPENLIMALSDVLNKDIPNNTGYQEPFTLKNLLNNKELQRGGMDLTDKTKGFPQKPDQPIKTGTPEQAKNEFLNTMETQLRRSGMENEISTYKDGKFEYKTIDSSKLTGEEIDNPQLVKEYENKIKAGERPKVLVRQQAGDLWISDGNHKLRAYKNLGIKDIPVIEVNLDSPIKTGGDVNYSETLKKDYTNAEKEFIRITGTKPEKIQDLTEFKVTGKIPYGYKGYSGPIFNEKTLKFDNQSQISPESIPKVEGDYLYHGTSDTVLDNISKEGLKPSMKGTTSLSKDESYSRSFAESSVFPKKEGQGIVLRVNKDLIKDTILPSNSKVPSDQLNEILTKKIIPPEYLEIYKNGKWQPIKSVSPESKGIKITETPKIKLKTIPLEQPTGPELRQRGFSASVQESPNVSKQVKQEVLGGYEPKPNDQLMGEAKALLTEGGQIDFKNIKDIDKKVAATIQEALNQQKAGNHQAAANLFNNLSEQGTELGRGVQAFSLLDNMSPEAIALSAAGKIKKYNQTAKVKIPELTGEQVKAISDKVAEADLLKGEARNKALFEINKMINEFIPSSLSDKALTVWKAGLLTSLRTHIRNFVGNTVHGVAETVKDIPATIADIGLSAKTGKRTITPTIKGTSEAWSKDTVDQMRSILGSGYDPDKIIEKFDTKQITWGKNLVEKGLKAYTDTVFRLLGAADKPFYNAAMARSLYSQAGAAAINAGKRGNKAFIDNLVKNPTEDMLKIAISDANVATFKDKNKATQIASALKRAMSTTKVGNVVSEITMPFTGVPGSVLGQIISYSPAGLIKGSIDAGRVSLGNMPELQRQAAQEIGRGVIGTGIFGLGSYLMSKGLMTGQPKDQEEQRQWELENKPRNSILIGGKWRSLNSIGPEAVVFLAGAKLNEELSSPEGNLGTYGVKLGKDYLDQSFVQGLQGPVNAITDPNRYAKSYIGNQLSSVVPNIVKDVSKATDPYQREANTVMDYAKQGIPGLRQTLTERRDVLGNIIPQEPTGGAAFVDIFNSKTPISNNVVNELSRLYNVGSGATPSKLSSSQTILKQKVKLTAEQLNQLEAGVGEELRPKLDTLISSPEYAQLDDEDKAKAIDKVVQSVRKEYKESMSSDFGIAKVEPSNKVSVKTTKTKIGKTKSKKKITFKVSSPKALPKITLKISSPVSRVKLKSAPKIKLSKTDNRKYTIKA